MMAHDFFFSDAEWDLLCLHGAQGDVLDALEAGDVASVRSLLDFLEGLHYVPDAFEVMMLRRGF